MRNIILFLFLTISVFSQQKGKIFDSETKEPIPYVNIAVENENKGISSDENGEFVLPISFENKNLVFTSVGFETKIIAANQTTNVFLKSAMYNLEEVFILPRFFTKQIEIGKTSNSTSQAFDNGPKIDVKYFPYLAKYKKTKFIKQVIIITDCYIDEASFKIHFYSIDENGFPGKEIVSKNIILTTKRGVNTIRYNVLDYNLQFPKSGLFVGFEKLIIDKNKLEKTIKNPNSGETKTTKTYYPLILYNSVESDKAFNFSGGKWNVVTNKTSVLEPSIRLILTN